MTDWGNVLSQSLPNLSGTPGRGATAAPTAAATPSQPPVARNIQWQTPGGSAATGLSSSRKASQTVEEMLAQHEQDIMDKLLHETEEATKTQTADFIKARMQQMWQEDREVWIQELIGVRSLGGLSATSKQQRPPGSGNTPFGLLPSPSGGAMTTLGGRHLTAPSSSSTAAGSAWSQEHALALGQGGRTQDLDPAFVQAHWEVLRTTSDSYHTAGNLKKLIDPSTNDPVLLGYATALDWTMTLLSSRSTESPIDRAAATLVHLCRQFQRGLKRRVQEAIVSGATTADSSNFTNEAARDCFQYSGLVLGDAHSVWSVLYYCLRIGNAQAALEVWLHADHSSNLTNSQYKAIRQILTVMAEGGVDCVWERGVPLVPANDRLELFDLLERQSNDNETMSDSANIHMMGVLAILSGLADLPQSETIPGFANTEDDLFGSLWKALMDNDPVHKLHEFAETIQAEGAERSHNNETGGWSYALHLLVSQQYARAFVHLAESGKDVLLHAAHLTLVLATAGVDISNLGEGNLNKDLVAKIVAAYANQLLELAGSQAALDYLIRIPDKALACKEVAKLIANTGEVTTLVGTFNANGGREGNETLDQHLSPAQISAVLAEAAALSMPDRSDRQKISTALLCYMSAERFDSVLVLLNELISPPDHKDENREHWILQTKQFHENFIDNRSGVFAVLERQQKTGLIQVSRTLMDLNRLFDLLHTTQYAEAWSVLKNLRLVPLVQTDMAMLVANFRTMDDIIRRSYPAVLKGAMQILYREHMRIKSDVQGGVAAVVLERLRELQQHARFVVTFAGLIGTAADKMESLSQMQALMI
jgi:hypothetical protein